MHDPLFALVLERSAALRQEASDQRFVAVARTRRRAERLASRSASLADRASRLAARSARLRGDIDAAPVGQSTRSRTTVPTPCA